MRDFTSESTRKRMPVIRAISVNIGPNRQMRRHSSPQLKDGESYRKNKPYESKK